MAHSLSRENRPLSQEDRRSLINIAVASILSGLDGRPPTTPDLAGLAESLREPLGAFVTLRFGGNLNGCIGVIRPEAALATTVAKVAWEAAFDDPRLPSLAPVDLPDTHIEISVLSALEPMAASTRDELLAGLRPGTDGLVLDSGYARATFLPAVWKECPIAQEFVSRLLFKAGLPPRGWPVGMKALRFTAFEFGAPFPAITDGARD